METNPAGKCSCKYEAGMLCFYTKKCTFPSLVVCLQQNLYLAQKEITLLRERRNLRHSKASLKWRNTSFYYKKKLKYLEAWLKEHGVQYPKVEELFSKEIICPEPVAGMKITGGDKDERIRSVGEKDTPKPNGDTHSNTVGSTGNPNSGQAV